MNKRQKKKQQSKKGLITVNNRKIKGAYTLYIKKKYWDKEGKTDAYLKAYSTDDYLYFNQAAKVDAIYLVHVLAETAGQLTRIEKSWDNRNHYVPISK